MTLSNSISQSTTEVSETPQNWSGVAGFHFSARWRMMLLSQTWYIFSAIKTHWVLHNTNNIHFYLAEHKTFLQLRKWILNDPKSPSENYNQRRDLHNIHKKNIRHIMSFVSYVDVATQRAAILLVKDILKTLQWQLDVTHSEHWQNKSDYYLGHKLLPSDFIWSLCKLRYSAEERKRALDSSLLSI